MSTLLAQHCIGHSWILDLVFATIKCFIINWPWLVATVVYRHYLNVMKVNFLTFVVMVCRVSTPSDFSGQVLRHLKLDLLFLVETIVSFLICLLNLSCDKTRWSKIIHLNIELSHWFDIIKKSSYFVHNRTDETGSE